MEYTNRTGKLGVNLIFIIGIADICIGTYLLLTNTVAKGTMNSGRFSSGGAPTVINGPWTIVIGIVLIILAIILKFINNPPKEN